MFLIKIICVFFLFLSVTSASESFATFEKKLNETTEISILKIFPKMPGLVFHTLSRREKKKLTTTAIRIDFDSTTITDDLIFSYQKLDKSSIAQAEIRPLISYFKSIANDKEVDQYQVVLSLYEKRAILKEIERRNNSNKARGRRVKLSTDFFNSLDDIFEETRIDPFDEDYDEYRNLGDVDNAYNIESNLKNRDVEFSTRDYRFKKLDTEVCAYNPKALSTCPKGDIDFTNDIESLDKAINLFKQKASQTVSEIRQEDKKYINGTQIIRLNSLARDFMSIDGALFRMGLKGEKVTLRRLKLIEYFFTPMNKYRYVRFFEEGAVDKSYASFFFHDLYDNAKKWKKTNKFSIPSKKVMKQVHKYFDSGFERFGNNLASGFVNVMGQIFKKRKYVPRLRVMTNFRKNYLTKNRKKTMSNLFDTNPMLMGDIIIEKDLQANSDIIIPGYWLHVSIFLGTIKEFKAMNLWDRDDFKNIRSDIERYRSDKDWVKFLRKDLKVTMEFEDIPWFAESDRPGVGVHPIQKFLQTDGMAVLRPTSKLWNEQQKKRIVKRVNERIGFPYDYVHNVRNKFSMSCSKFALKVFDFIDFPVSNNLKYVTHSPDQTGMPVSGDFNAAENGQLKLIKFFDAYDKGNITFDSISLQSPGAYRDYLKSIDK